MGVEGAHVPVPWQRAQVVVAAEQTEQHERVEDSSRSRLVVTAIYPDPEPSAEAIEAEGDGSTPFVLDDHLV